jgi:hypothetical protein
VIYVNKYTISCFSCKSDQVDGARDASQQVASIKHGG